MTLKEDFFFYKKHSLFLKPSIIRKEAVLHRRSLFLFYLHSYNSTTFKTLKFPPTSTKFWMVKIYDRSYKCGFARTCRSSDPTTTKQRKCSVS